MDYPIRIEQGEGNWFVAICPKLPGCVSQGRTEREALENVREAMEAYLESLRQHGESVPWPSDQVA